MSNNNTISVTVLVIVGIFVLVPTLAVSIASIVIASNHDGATCDGDMMPLPIWLYVYGGTGLTMVALLLITVALLLSGNNGALVAYICLYILFGLFMLCWNIVGAVALFRDSAECEHTDHPLWAMTLAVLIIQWIGMVVSCCHGKKDDDDNN